MKTTLTLFLLLSSTILIGQTTDSLGFGDNAFLNKSELNYMDSIFKGESSANFQGQKILFISHQSKVEIISKKDFFDKFIKPFRNKNILPSFSTRSVQPDEKKQSGGYIFIFIAPSGDIPANERSKIFKQLAKEKKKK